MLLKTYRRNIATGVALKLQGISCIYNNLRSKASVPALKAASILGCDIKKPNA
jgi:hypothetical protein